MFMFLSGQHRYSPAGEMLLERLWVVRTEVYSIVLVHREYASESMVSRTVKPWVASVRVEADSRSGATPATTNAS